MSPHSIPQTGTGLGLCFISLYFSLFLFLYFSLFHLLGCQRAGKPQDPKPALSAHLGLSSLLHCKLSSRFHLDFSQILHFSGKYLMNLCPVHPSGWLHVLSILHPGCSSPLFHTKSLPQLLRANQPGWFAGQIPELDRKKCSKKREKIGFNIYFHSCEISLCRTGAARSRILNPEGLE